MEGILVHVERRYRNAEPGPNAVVVDATRHDVNQNLILTDRPGRQHLELHGAFRRTVALLADGPGMHLCRHVAKQAEFHQYAYWSFRGAACGRFVLARAGMASPHVHCPELLCSI